MAEKQKKDPDFGRCEHCGEDLVALDYRDGEPTKCHWCKVETRELIA